MEKKAIPIIYVIINAGFVAASLFYFFYINNINQLSGMEFYEAIEKQYMPLYYSFMFVFLLPWVIGIVVIFKKEAFLPYKRGILLWMAAVIIFNIYNEKRLYEVVFRDSISYLTAGINSLLPTAVFTTIGLMYELYLSKSKKIRSYFEE
jgi:hypothetical protein